MMHERLGVWNNAELRKEKGLMNQAEVCALANVCNDKMAYIRGQGLMPKPALQAPGGRMSLWHSEDIYEFVASTDFDKIVYARDRSQRDLTMTEGEHLRMANRFYRALGRVGA